MVDEETGVEPVASDGEPNDDLSRRRAARRAARRARGRATSENGGGSIAERGADGGGEPEEEMFPLGTLAGDPRATLRTLIRSGLPVETTASLMSAEVPLRDGLLDPNEDGRVVVSFEAAKFEVVPKKKDDKIVGWKIRQVLRPTYVENAETAVPGDAAAG